LCFLSQRYSHSQGLFLSLRFALLSSTALRSTPTRPSHPVDLRCCRWAYMRVFLVDVPPPSGGFRVCLCVCTVCARARLCLLDVGITISPFRRICEQELVSCSDRFGVRWFCLDDYDLDSAPPRLTRSTPRAHTWPLLVDAGNRRRRSRSCASGEYRNPRTAARHRMDLRGARHESSVPRIGPR
jgi:hypothetical protein